MTIAGCGCLAATPTVQMLGQQDLTSADARQLIGSNRILGLVFRVRLRIAAPMNQLFVGLRRHRTDFRYAIQNRTWRGHWSHCTAVYRRQGAEAFRPSAHSQ